MMCIEYGVGVFGKHLVEPEAGILHVSDWHARKRQIHFDLHKCANALQVYQNLICIVQYLT